MKQCTSSTSISSPESACSRLQPDGQESKPSHSQKSTLAQTQLWPINSPASETLATSASSADASAIATTTKRKARPGVRSAKRISASASASAPTNLQTSLDFPTSSQRKGLGLDDPRSGLIVEPLRIADQIRPAFLFFENVPAIKSRGADTILEGLEVRGYTAQTFVVGASNVGGEHRRKRAWIVAYDSTQRIQGLRPEREQESHTLAPAFLPVRDGVGQWQVEPDVRRAVDGDARWMDRLACIGNAVVPQIPVAFFDWMREVTRSERMKHAD